jgi:sterol 3beta-glucosyltransferase
MIAPGGGYAMRIVVIAVGTWGDVAPYTGLGRRLQESGHEVAVAAHAPFEEAVRERGLGFRPLPMDIRQTLGSAQGQQVLRTTPLATARFIRMYAQHWEAMAEATEAAAEGADLLLTSAMGWLGIHVAEAKGIPSAGVYLQPMDSTGDFPPWLLTTRSLGRWGTARRRGPSAAPGCCRSKAWWTACGPATACPEWAR